MEEELALSRLAMEKSNRLYEDARILKDMKRYESSLSRLYYSVFWIITALARITRFNASSHKALINYINRVYVVENKILTDSFYRSVRKLMTYREYSDYDEVLGITQDEIKEAFCIADMIISETKQYLRSI
jgi:uncharacterized protein (UPF0332 family)